MTSLNRVLLIGNLTRDPELRYTPNGTPVAEFGLAVNREFRGDGGEKREETCFIDCLAWQRQAEVICQFLARGRAVFLEGRLQLDTWQSPQGEKRSKHRVVVERFEFIDGAGGDRQASSQP